jgi:hypothetical protein
LRPVGGGDHDDPVAVVGSHAVEAGEELGLEAARGLVVRLLAGAEDGVDFVCSGEKGPML